MDIGVVIKNTEKAGMTRRRYPKQIRHATPAVN